MFHGILGLGIITTLPHRTGRYNINLIIFRVLRIQTPVAGTTDNYGHKGEMYVEDKIKNWDCAWIWLKPGLRTVQCSEISDIKIKWVSFYKQHLVKLYTCNV